MTLDAKVNDFVSEGVAYWISLGSGGFRIGFSLRFYRENPRCMKVLFTIFVVLENGRDDIVRVMPWR